MRRALLPLLLPLGCAPWNQPQTLGPFKDSPLLFSIYREYKDWGKILNLASVGQLNELINARQIKQFIPVAEALHDKKISRIADRISERRDTVRLALVAGPSSSGKTTFAKKLSIQLQVLGRNPCQISLDDYFLPRDRTPRNADGRYDSESLRAIDVEAIRQVGREYRAQVQAEAQLRTRELKQLLAGDFRIAGSAVMPNLAADAQWQETVRQLKAVFNSRLASAKSRIGLQ